MKYTKINFSDLNVSSVCLGTMTFGEQTKKKEAIRILDFAFQNGINYFDTAEMYPIYPKKKTHGRSEEYLGEWIKKRKIRDKVYISTKICSGNQAGTGATNLSWIRGGGSNLNFSKKNMNDAVNQSLKRLKTNYIDIYKLHFPERNVPMYGTLDFDYEKYNNNWTPIMEVIENISILIKQGKIRYYGISNETPWGISKFIHLSEKYNLPRPIIIQNVYNLLNRVFDIASSEFLMHENFQLAAYSPLAGGRLTGKYLKSKAPKNSRYTLWPGRFSRHLTSRGEKAITRYSKLSKKLGYDLIDMANLFVLSRPFVACSIIGVTSVNQLRRNIKFLDLKIDRNVLKKINEIHYKDPNPCV